MGKYVIRRLLGAIPTILIISFLVFAILDLAPSDPTANLPLTIPQEVRENIREALGVNQPFFIKYLLWLRQFFITEPVNVFEDWWGTDINVPFVDDTAEETRIISWTNRSPVMDLIIQRLPQTLKVVGLAYLISVILAIPIGIISAYKQYSIFDQIGTLFAMVGFSVPTFFTGVAISIVFGVWLGWFPTVYNTTLEVTNWETFVQQLKQSFMPVTVLALFQIAQLSQFARASVLENLHQDYVRTARAKGLHERVVLLVHILRNSLIPVVTLIALGIPGIFGGAIVTEQVFRVNGLGALLIDSINNGNIPLAQTLLFIFAALIVLFNIVADVLYGFLDPRIRYD